MKKISFVKWIVVTVGFLFQSSLFSQSFIKTISSGNDDFLMQPSIEMYQNNSVVVSTVSIDANQAHIPNGATEVLVKMLDDNGNVLWSKRVNADNYNYTQIIAGGVTTDYDIDGQGTEAIVVTGSVWSPGVSSIGPLYKHLFILRLDPTTGGMIDYNFYHGNLDNGVYGFDIESTGEGYIVVGSKTIDRIPNPPPPMNVPKSALVFGVDKELSLIWSKEYTSNSTSNFYNTFNHVLKVEGHPAGGELFLLTGTGVNYSNFPATAIDLIDVHGNSIWQNPKNYTYETGMDTQYGYSSLYNPNTNEFYVAGNGGESKLHVLTLDGNTGNIISSSKNIYFDIDKVFSVSLINGMEWNSIGDNEILLSGYTLHKADPPNPSLDGVYEFLIKLNMGSLATQAFIFDKVNEKNALLNIDFDYMVKPITYDSGTTTYQYFYKPKSLVKNNGKINFIGMNFNPTTGGQDLNLYSLTSFDGKCIIGSIKVIPSIKPNWFSDDNFTGSINSVIPYFGNISSSGIVLEVDDFCSPVQIFNLGQEMNKAKIEKSIKIHPVPAKNQITISSGSNMLTNTAVYIYDVLGREVIYKSIHQANNTVLDISKIQPGVYFVKILNKENRVIKQQKIIKE